MWPRMGVSGRAGGSGAGAGGGIQGVQASVGEAVMSGGGRQLGASGGARGGGGENREGRPLRRSGAKPIALTVAECRRLGRPRAQPSARLFLLFP